MNKYTPIFEKVDYVNGSSRVKIIKSENERRYIIEVNDKEESPELIINVVKFDEKLREGRMYCATKQMIWVDEKPYFEFLYYATIGAFKHIEKPYTIIFAGEGDCPREEKLYVIPIKEIVKQRSGMGTSLGNEVFCSPEDKINKKVYISKEFAENYAIN